MMVAQVLTNNQQEETSRQQKRAEERHRQKAAKKLERLAAKTNLPITFDNASVTAYGNFGLFEAFKKVVGLQELLQEHTDIKRRHNCLYSAHEIIDTMVDAAALGLLRFSHMGALKQDPGYQTLKARDTVPDERTLRYLLAKLTEKHVEQLRNVNDALLLLKANMDGPRSVWLDFDDSVITVFGNQEGSEVGYNPRYHGRSSYKVKVAFVSESAELINADLCGGKTASNGGFLDFLKETLAKIDPRKTVVEGIRIDRGFFDEANFIYLEDQDLRYVCKGKMTGGMKKVLDYLNEQDAWEALDKTYATAEITIPLPSWTRSRRLVFIRERIRPKEIKCQMCLDLDAYEHQVIVTNMDDLTCEEVWHWYNKRCNIENKIDELKVGLGLDQTSQHEMQRNVLYMWIKILAYNLLNWFRLAVFPEEASHHEIPTLRRLILNVPGNIVGQGRYRHVKLAPNRWLEKTIETIKAKFKEFITQRACQWVGSS
ncbi:MAG: IS1380 family transposase [Desulfitobacteriaceae bacterium]